MAKQPYKTLHERAGESLAGTNHSVFNAGELKIRTTSGGEPDVGWQGAALTHFTVHKPTTVTRAWRAFFKPHNWNAMLPAELTEQEAWDTAQALMDMANLRRRGA